MIVKTKKYQLDQNTYLRIALSSILRKQWWVWFVPFAIMLIPIFYAPALWWCFGIALIASILYLLFWTVQFVGVTQMEQTKFFFEKLTYEIDSRQILIKRNATEGMPLTWDKITKVEHSDNQFILYLSLGQFILLPYSVFKTEHEIKFLEAILKRKNLFEEANDASFFKKMIDSAFKIFKK